MAASIVVIAFLVGSILDAGRESEIEVTQTIFPIEMGILSNSIISKRLANHHTSLAVLSHLFGRNAVISAEESTQEPQAYPAP